MGGPVSLQRSLRGAAARASAVGLAALLVFAAPQGPPPAVGQLSAVAAALPGEAPAAQAVFQGAANPRFAPGEVIVKFRAGSGLGAVAPLLADRGQSFASLTGTTAIDDLNRRFGARGFRPLFPGFRAGLRTPPGPVTPEAAGRLQRELSAARAAAFERAGRRFPQRRARAGGGTEAPTLEDVLLLELTAPEADPALAAAAYAALPEVEYAQPNWRYEPDVAPDDPYYTTAGSWGQPYDDLWALKRIEAEAAWSISRGEGSVVAVVDTGVDCDHEDLAANILRDGGGTVVGYDFSDGDADPADYQGHGTHVAGTIAAAADNGVGIAGVAPRARIMPVKVFPNSYSSVCAAGIHFAADNGADVLNNSWGIAASHTFGDPVLSEAVEYAHALGCVVVFAAGNDAGDVAYHTPANHPLVIAVTSTDRADRRSDFSNYGLAADVAAPGGDSADASANRAYQNILSLRAEGTDLYGDGVNIVGERYIRARGTSMAAPHVSGVAALLVSAHPGWDNGLVRGQIVNSADDIDAVNPAYAGLLGGGRLNAERALTVVPEVRVRYLGRAVRDEGPAGGGDGLLSPGESAGMTVTLENTWAPASGIVARLSTADPLVTISRDTAAFGDLPAGGTAENDAEPFLVSVSPDAPLGHAVEFFLAIGADGFATSARFSVEVALPTLPGWPLRLPFSDWGQYRVHALADADGDGADEILLGDIPLIDGTSLGQVHIFRADGTELPGWPQRTLADNGRVTTMLVGDIDGDGDREVVAAARAIAGIPNGRLYAWHVESGAPVDGWPVSFGRLQVLDVILADFDDDPRDREVAVAVNNSVTPLISILQGDGQPLPGWPITYPITGGGSVAFAQLAAADLDGDGGTEIVMATSFRQALETRPSPLYVYHADGTPAAGWPQTLSGQVVDPVLGDLDGDGRLEIVVGGRLSGTEGPVHAFRHDGGELPGWPITTLDGEPVLSDLDGDGRPEVLVRDRYGRIQAFDEAGRDLATLAGNISSKPSVVDLDGDGRQELVFSLAMAGGEYALAVHDWEGAPEPGLRFPFETYSPLQPSVGDVDGDGDLEIVANDYNQIYVYDLPWGRPPRLEWPVAQHDPGRTGCHAPVAAVNGAPTGLALTPAAVSENQPAGTAVGTLTATDPDAGDTFTFTLVAGAGDTGNASFQADGDTLRAAVPLDREALPGGWTSVRLRVTDRGGAWFERQVDVLVTDVDEPPVARDDTAATAEDTPVDIPVLANDSDPEGAQLAIVSPPIACVFVAGQDCPLDYRPPENFCGTAQVPYRVSDGLLTATASVTVTVTCAPDDPTDIALSTASVPEGRPAGTLVGILSTADPDAGDTFVYRLVGGDTAAFSVDGDLLRTAAVLDFEAGSSRTVTIRSTDQTGRSIGKSFAIAVTDVNEPPRIVAVNELPGREGELLQFTAEAVDPDAGDTLTWSITGSRPDGADIDPAAGLFSWIPSYEQEGNWTITFTVTDGQGESDSRAATIVVAHGNRPPVLDPVGDRAAVEGEPLAFVVTGFDPDGDPAALSAEGLPGRATFDAATGAFAWTPGFSDAGSHQVVFRIREVAADGGEDWELVTIAVGSPVGPIFSDDFSDGTAAGDADWVVRAGRWRAGRGVYRSSSRRSGITTIVRLDPLASPVLAGEVRATVKLTRVFRRTANAAIVFGYQDWDRFRYVKLLPGRVLVGQVGALGGDTGGVKKRFRRATPLGRARRWTVRVHADGRVEVLLGSRLVGAHRFLAAVPGGVGLAANRAVSVFDDVEVLDDSALAP